MGVLARFERRLGGAFEGSFAKVFRSRVEPVELAVALKRECDDEKSVGPVQTMVPNDFAIDLGPADHGRLAPYILTLADELAAMVQEHATEQGYSFLGPIAVTFLRDPGLSTGTYRISSQVEAGDEAPARPPAARAAARLPVPSPAVLPVPPVRPVGPDDRTRVVARSAPVTYGRLELPDGSRVTIPADGLTVGRGQDCGVRLADASVSRRHAEITVEDGVAHVEDLASTNGTTVGGERIVRAELRDGDRITFGAATVTYRG